LRIKLGLAVFTCIFFLNAGPAHGQQKGQYIPGQQGLNAGALPDPGFTYANLTLNYSADTLKNASGNSVPLTGSYNIWAVENIFFYVPKFKLLGAKLAVMVAAPTLANGSLTLGSLRFPNIALNAGGEGLASDNVGSGYWGNHLITGSTFYITKNKGTTANLFTDWEFHGSKATAAGTSATPGQAFTMEWGLGQVLPLKKDFSRLLQLGVIGYDQWQVSDNQGLVSPNIPTNALPYYSVHAIGFQTNFILPAKALNFLFKFEDEYRAFARPEGHTIVFGGSYTFRIPKLQAPPSGPEAPATP
jgi:hypothetical protein